MKRIVVGVTGASGSAYAHRLLDVLGRLGHVADVVFTKTGRLVWRHELGTEPSSLDHLLYGPSDFTAPFASGSTKVDGMVVVPCSAGTLARVASGVSTDLVGRAADVMLKERRPLVLVLRESPYSLIQLRNMVTVTEAGAVVLPASPSFYSQPDTREALLDTVVCRVLDQLGIENELSPRWRGLHPEGGRG